MGSDFLLGRQAPCIAALYMVVNHFLSKEFQRNQSFFFFEGVKHSGRKKTKPPSVLFLSLTIQTKPKSFPFFFFFFYLKMKKKMKKFDLILRVRNSAYELSISHSSEGNCRSMKLNNQGRNKKLNVNQMKRNKKVKQRRRKRRKIKGWGFFLKAQLKVI